MGSVLHHDDVRVELAQFVPIGESFVPHVWVETDDTAAFEDAVRADDRVATLTAVDRAADRTLYKVEWTEAIDGFLSTVAEHGLLVESATGADERWQFRLQGPDRENLSSFQRALQEKEVPVTVHRVQCPEVSDEDRYGLTAKQRETLEIAFEEGYFEIPRGASLTDLAERLDVSHQSVSRRVRGGLDNLLAATLADDPNAEGGINARICARSTQYSEGSNNVRYQ